MTGPVKFLYARLDETERRVFQHDDAFLTGEDEERILEMVAHRRVALLEHRECDETCFEVRMYLLRHSDHPDYDERWRP